MSASGTELRYLVQGVETWSPAKEAPDDPFNYVDLSSVDRELKEITAPQGMTGAEAPSRARQLLKSGDVLVSTVRPNLNAVAHVPDALDGATGSTGFCVLRADPGELDGRYLFHWTRSPSFVAAMVRRATGASYPAVSDRIVKESKIPLPPLPEQQRIAAILDKADTVRRKRQQTLDLADQFLRSAFLDLFGDPVTNPKRWPVLRLEEVCTRITDGTHQPPDWSEEGYPFLFVSNIVDGGISFGTRKHISEETWEELTRRCPIELNDILYTTVGSYGNAALVDTERRFAFQRHIAHVKPDEGRIHPEFLVGMLQSPAVRTQADRAVRGIAQKTLNLADLKKFRVFVPPRDVQEMYVRLRRRTLEQRLSVESALARADNLGDSLVQRAFRGEL